MWQTVLISGCLVLVIEGFLPFIAPKLWRKSMLQASLLTDKNLRIIGLFSMLLGTVMLYVFH